MKLAQQVGKPLSQVRKEYDAVDFTWWNLWEEISPGAPERLDILVGQICAYIANASAGRNTRMLTVNDCMMKFEAPKEIVPVANVKDLKSKVRSLIASARGFEKGRL